MPISIQGLNKDQVTFVWSDEHSDVWPARVLRLRCTCAYCKSEDTGARLIVDAQIPEEIVVTQMRLVGNYGLNIHFSDGHSTGIYRLSGLKSRQFEGPVPADKPLDDKPLDDKPLDDKPLDDKPLDDKALETDATNDSGN